MIPIKYLVVIEAGSNGFRAYVPVVTGCVALAETRSRVAGLIQEDVAA